MEPVCCAGSVAATEERTPKLINVRMNTL
jgi:hypothetical protein